jgi:hypothetical protein
LPEGLDVELEITLRQARLLNLRSTASAVDQAKASLQSPTEERHEAEKAEYEATTRERVEPAIGIIEETLGFRRFSLRGLLAVAGEW